MFTSSYPNDLLGDLWRRIWHNLCVRKKAGYYYYLWNAGICPIASKVGHVTLAMPTFGVIHHPLYTTSSNGSNRENMKSLASAV